jgi:hypothetical protein
LDKLHNKTITSEVVAVDEFPPEWKSPKGRSTQWLCKFEEDAYCEFMKYAPNSIVPSHPFNVRVAAKCKIPLGKSTFRINDIGATRVIEWCGLMEDVHEQIIFKPTIEQSAPLRTVQLLEAVLAELQQQTALLRQLSIRQ